jgi:hypothetical protein
VWERTAGRMWHETHVNELTIRQWMEALGKYFKVQACRRHWYVDLIIPAKKEVE